MPANPLFPGYIPDEKNVPAENPLFPGYYPGTAQQRRREPFNPVPEYKPPTLIEDQISMMENEMTLAWAPTWVKDRIRADITNALTPIGKGKIEFDSERALLMGDVDEIPGVQLRVNLDPREWAKDPAKAVLGLGKHVFEEVFDYEDMEHIIERKTLYAPLINGDIKMGGAWGANTVGASASKIFGPMQLTGQGAAFQKAGEGFLSFMQSGENAVVRKKEYSKFREAAASAVKEDFEKNYSRFTAAEKIKVDALNANISAVEAFGNLQNDLKGMNGQAANIKLHISKGNAITPEMEKDFEQRVLNLKKSASNLVSSSKAGLISNARTASARAGVDFSHLGELDNFVAEAHALANSVGSVAGNPTAIMTASAGAATLLKKAESSGTLKNIEGRLLDSVVHTELASGKGPLGIREIAKKYSMTSERLARVATLANRRYEYAEFEDLLGALESGKYLQKYQWAKYSKRIEKFLPAYYIKKFLTKTHYFGLLYNEENEYEVFGALKGMENADFMKHRININVSIDIPLPGGGFRTERISLKGIETHGKKWLNPVTGKWEYISNFSHGLSLEKDLLLIKGAMSPTDRAALFDKINRFKSSKLKETIAATQFQKWLIVHAKELNLTVVGGKIEETAENAEKIKGLILHLGILEQNPFSASIIKSARLGLLTKAAFKLSEFQDALLNKLKVGGKTIGQWVSPVFQIKDMVAEAVAQAFSKAISGALAGATGGIGAVLDPVIKFVTKYIVRKVIDFGETIGKVLLQANLRELDKFLDSTGQTVGKFMGIIAVIPALIVAIAILPIFTITGAFTPANPIPDSTPRTPEGNGPIDGTPGGPGVGGGGQCNGEGPDSCDPRTGMDTLPGSNSASNIVARKAYEIAVPLEKGFWCYWNYQPSFPSIWNQSEWDTYGPNHCYGNTASGEVVPAGCCGSVSALSSFESLFWCTQLVVHAYQDSGAFPFPGYGASGGMKHYIQRTPPFQFYANEAGVKNRVKPGDIIFYEDKGARAAGTEFIAHVGIVYTVDSNGITTIESNTVHKSMSHAFMPDGSVAIPHGSLQVNGFGGLR